MRCCPAGLPLIRCKSTALLPNNSSLLKLLYCTNQGAKSRCKSYQLVFATDFPAHCCVALQLATARAYQPAERGLGCYPGLAGGRCYFTATRKSLEARITSICSLSLSVESRENCSLFVATTTLRGHDALYYNIN